MPRQLSVLLFVFALLISLPAMAQKDILGKAQPWAPTGGVTISPAQPGTVSVENASADLRFDPRKLDESTLVITATYVPQGGFGANGDSSDGQGTFISKSIKQTGKNSFTATGDFMMARNEKVPVTIPFTASFAKGQARPTLVIQGTFDAPLGQITPGLRFPSRVPMTFNMALTAI